jgi:4-hydroxy-4-methyl-2-oxoglutarate aldolase
MASDLAKFSAPTLYEVSQSVLALGSALKPLYLPIQLAGPAYTVLAAPQDNLAIHRALAECPPGHVLVVATGRDSAHGFVGEIMMEAALARGVAGLVIDGGVRDTRAMRDRFPVFCGGVAIPGTAKRWPGVLNEPVVIDDVLIHPGDWIVGDDDGVVVVREAEANDVAAKARARVLAETSIIEGLRGGKLTIDLLDLRKLLRERHGRS